MNLNIIFVLTLEYAGFLGAYLIKISDFGLNFHISSLFSLAIFFFLFFIFLILFLYF